MLQSSLIFLQPVHYAVLNLGGGLSVAGARDVPASVHRLGGHVGADGRAQLLPAENLLDHIDDGAFQILEVYPSVLFLVALLLPEALQEPVEVLVVFRPDRLAVQLDDAAPIQIQLGHARLFARLELFGCFRG